MNSELPIKLPAYERITALTLAIFILFLVGFNYYFDEITLPIETEEPHYIVSPLIEVTIKGAVASPGVYQVKKGSAVSEAIEMAGPLETANFKGIKLDSKITRRRTITLKDSK